MNQENSKDHSAQESNPEWVCRLNDFLQKEHGLEAVKLDLLDKKVSIATLGSVDSDLIEDKLKKLIASLDKKELWAAARDNKTRQLSYGSHIDEGDGKLQLEKPSCVTAPSLWHWREFALPIEEQSSDGSGEEWKTLSVQAGICGLALLAGYLANKFQWLEPNYVKAIYSISMLAGGWDAAKDAWAMLLRKRLDVHFLMIAVAIGAVLVGAWHEGALLLFLFSMSGALEHYALNRMNREISALTKAAPKTARVILESGNVEVRNVESLKKGDKLEIRPDEIFPVDGIILEGKTEVDESNLTGEARPVPKNKGEELYSGTLNLWGMVIVQVTRPVEESSLAKIVRMIRHAQENRAPSQRFTDRFGSRYAISILLFSLVMFFVWWLGLGLDPFQDTSDQRSALYRAMALLVVASPCALVLSIPSAILAGIAWGARHGILFRGGSAIEKLAEINTVAMDKTGTLTAGKLELRGIESFPPGNETAILELAYCIEKQSNHPIARAITKYCEQENIPLLKAKDIRSITGSGIRATVDRKNVYIGRRELLSQVNEGQWVQNLPQETLENTEVWIVSNGIIGRILLQDEIRKESSNVIAQMKADGITTVMLTGDNRGAAESVARDIGIDDVRAGLHPEDKVKIIYQLTDSGQRVAMVGDGVNDAPSLAAAHVSISMGNRGSDAALEQADIVLMDDKIEKLKSAMLLSRKSRRIIKQNLLISLGTVIIMVTTTLISTIPLSLAVMVHESSTVLVCLNSLRLLFFKERND